MLLAIFCVCVKKKNHTSVLTESNEAVHFVYVSFFFFLTSRSFCYSMTLRREKKRILN